MSNNKWANLAVAYLALVAAFLPYVGWSPSLRIISGDLGLTYSQAGAISSITGAVAGVTVLIGGVVAARHGSKRVILIGLAAGVGGQGVFALAGGFEVLVVARVLAGLAVGFLWVATITMAVGWFRSTERTGHALGIMMSGDGVGALLGLFVFSAVLTTYGWRTGLTIQAVCLGVVLVVVLLVSRNAPVHADDPVAAPASRPVPTGSGGARARPRTLLTRNVLAAGIFEIGTVGLFAVIPSWMPAILVEDAGMSESRAGFVTSLFSIVGMAAAFSVPAIAEKWGSRKRVIIVGSVITVAALAVLTVSLAKGDYLMVAALVPVIGVGVYTCEPLTIAGAVESVDSRLTGVVNGIVFGVPWFISGFAYPNVVGAIRDATGGFVEGFVVLTIATVVTCTVASALIRDPSPAPDVTPDALENAPLNRAGYREPPILG